jgi:plasmid maintenance system antidote protein VapI
LPVNVNRQVFWELFQGIEMTKKKLDSDLADCLRQRIAASGLSLYKLGKVSGVDESRLSRFMRGERDLTLAGAAQICKFLGITFATSPVSD